MYAGASVKRQKVVRDATRPSENEVFQGISRIEYKPDVNFTCDEQLAFRYYNASERIHGRQMEDWLRASVYYGKYFNCSQTYSLHKAFATTNRSMETVKKNLRAMFEMCIKMGVKFWSGYDDDLIPEGDTFEGSHSNYEQISEILNEYQQKTSIKPLWIGVNFKHNRFNNGASTNSDANVVAYAGYQVKRAMDMANKLNAECFLINGNREGYDNTMNTELSKEIKHYARFLKIVVEYRDKIGFRGQLLLAYDNTHDQGNNINDNQDYFDYTNNVFSCLLFMKQFNFDRYFKLNVSPGHEFNMANVYGCLGCLDVKQTLDIADIPKITLLLRTIIEKGGLGQLGITFHMPIYNHASYVEPKEVMESFVNALDSYGKAFRFAVKLVNDVQINQDVQTRYASFQTGWGMKFMTSDANLGECEEYAKRLQEANALCNTNKSNHWYVVLQRYVDSTQQLK